MPVGPVSLVEPVGDKMSVCVSKESYKSEKNPHLLALSIEQLQKRILIE